MTNDNPRDRATYFGRAQADLAEAGGRFARPKPTVTSGAGGAGVPTQPATSPWARDPVGQEQPFGYSVDDAPIVGEAHEVERSLAALTVEQEQEAEE
jgi:hypothetical protein